MRSNEITVVDDSDHVGWLASATRIGEVYMTNVATMVANVLAELGTTRKMSRLNILDHGNSSGFEVGSDWVDVTSVVTFEPTLTRLRGKFEQNGFVHLQACEVGQNRVLLLELARIFNVPIYAGTGLHNPVYRFNFGHYVRADPGGAFNNDAGRP